MKLFQYMIKAQPRIGIEIENKKYNFSQIWEFFKDIKGYHQQPQLLFIQMMLEMDIFNFSDINEIITTVKNFRTFSDIQLNEPFEWEIPVSRPSKIICLGRNYGAHAKELGNDTPEEPIIFAKMPSAMIAHEKQIIIPKNVGRVDHEIELAIVIGKQANNILPKYASDFIAGYTIVNDVTARAQQKMDINNKLPWLRSKNYDTFMPIGPYLVPKDVITNPQNLNMTLKVNDEIRQSSNSSKMIFKIDEIISYISSIMTLVPGDIIATGTPEGISELKPGDYVSAQIDEIGILENNVL